MANPSEKDRTATDEQLHDLIAEYHDRLDQGEVLESAEFVAEHPDLEAELSRYFENVATLESLAGPTVSQVKADPTATVITGETHNGGHTETMIESSRSGDSVRLSKDAPRTQFGRYRIVQELGRGAMGAVYLAHDEQLDREVALKIPQFDAGMNDDLLERFYREARAAAALQHAGICPVFDVGELDGQHYITMGFIKGRPLRDFTRSSKRQKGKQVARVIRKIAMAMAEAHDHNVIHRDLKPANIMINEKNEPVVMDFGLARRSTEGEERLTHTGTVIGTPAYMSPEQVDGDNDNVGPAADIYSLGVIFYELLTGQLPFQGNLMSILKQIAADDPKPPNEIHHDIDPSLQAICLSMMEKKAEDRPASMQAVARELASWLQGRQIVADETEPLETSQISAKPSAENDEATAHLTDEPVAATIIPGQEATLSRPQSDAGSEGRPRNRWPLIAGTLGGAAVLLASILIIVQLGKVKVQITLDDPSYSLKVDDDVLILEGAGDLESRSKSIRLSADEHKLTVMQGDLVIDNPKSFTVTKDGKNAITVFVLGDEVAILPDGEQPPALPDEDSLPAEPTPPLTGETIDLLALLDPERDFPAIHLAKGKPVIRDGILWTPAVNEFFTGIFRCDVPEQYDIHLQLERKSDRGGFEVGIVMGSQQATVGMDCGPDNPKWGMEMIDGKSMHTPGNPARKVGGRLRIGDVNNVTIRVLKDRVIMVDGEETIFDWKGTPSQLSLWKSDDIPLEPCLFFRSKDEFHVYKMTMTPIGDSSAVPAIVPSTNVASEVWTTEWTWTKPISLEKLDGPTELQLVSVDGLSTLLFEAGKPGSRDIWQRDRLPGSSTWSKPQKLDSPINSATDEASPFLSRDGKTLIFESDRPGGSGQGDLWISTRDTVEGSWSVPVNMGENVNSARAEGLATLSADGRQLIFASDRRGSTGLSDLWECRRESTKDAWSPARNIKSLNSVGRDLAPLLSSDDLSLILTSDRLGGEGSADLWLSRRTSRDGPWSSPVNLGKSVNTSGFEYGLILSGDSKSVIYNSNLRGKRSTWLSRRVPKIQAEVTQSPPLAVAPFNSETETVHALKFASVRNYVEVPTLKCDGLKAVTMEAWLSPYEGRLGSALTFEKDGGHTLILQIGGFPRWEFGGVIREKKAFAWAHGPNIQEWERRTHVAGTYADDQFTLFVNGEKITTVDVPVGYEPSGSLCIGRWTPDAPPQGAFQGTIDEIRVSSAVRYKDDFEPEQRFNSDASTLALYHFEEGQGNVLNDSSGNNHHGKIVGADWVQLDGGPGQPLDILAGIEPATLNSENMKWEFNNGILTGNGIATVKEKKWGGVSFSQEIRGDYDLDLEFKQSTFAPLQIDLPLGDQQAIRVHLGGVGSALMMIDGKQDRDAAAPYRNDDAKMKKNVWHRLKAKIRHLGKEVSIDATLDGKRIGQFYGDRSRISLPHWVKPDPVHLRMAGHADFSKVRLEFRRVVFSSASSDTSAQQQERDAIAPPLAIAPFDETQAKAHQKAWADHLGVPVEKEVELPGGEKVAFILIPPGEFQMGSTDQERGRLREEALAIGDDWTVDRIVGEDPQHKVRITQPFYLGKYEVTQAQWQSVTGDNPSKFSGMPTHPVEQVSWDDVQGFVKSLNKINSSNSLTFVLPTEAQWEYACRAGTATRRHFGDSENELRTYGWFEDNTRGSTQPVGQLRPNPFGLYDMYGNVWEWCPDWYRVFQYALSPVDDPVDAVRTTSSTTRVIRGGCWGRPAGQCRSANRGNIPPDRSEPQTGFRLALTIGTP